MNITREEYTAFLNSRLPPAHHAEIQAFLKDNPLERRALEGQLRYESQSLLDESSRRLEERIHAVVSEKTKINQHKEILLEPKPINRRSWIITISALAAGLALLLMFLPSQIDRSPIVLAEMVEAYPDVLTNIVRGESADETTMMTSEAMSYYNSGQYDKAESALLALSESTQGDQITKFYLGVSQFFNLNYQGMTETFNSLRDGSFAFEDGVMWYQALAYIHLNKDNEAKDLLSNIAAQDHYKSKDAMILLDNYDKIVK